MLVRWLDMASKDATEIFLMGDVFDFWFEYNYVVPKGYVRLLGKIAEITDSGIPMHLFRGNHDIWAFDYLDKELNVDLHRKPQIREYDGKRLFLAHGDGILHPGNMAVRAQILGQDTTVPGIARQGVDHGHARLDTK